jgi:hypothetical protein
VKTLSWTVRRVVDLAILILVAYAGWKWGGLVFPGLEARLGVGEVPAIEVEGVEPSEELGAAALGRIEDFLEGGDDELALTGLELTSILRYGRPDLTGLELTSILRYGRPDLVPAGLQEPSVRLDEGRAYATADVSLSQFPALEELGPVTGILPDPVSLELQGSVMGFGDRSAALVVQGIQVAGVPLPRRLIPEVVRALRTNERPGLPDEALVVVLPAGIASAHVVGDRLVLLAES